MLAIKLLYNPQQELGDEGFRHIYVGEQLMLVKLIQRLISVSP